MEDQPHLSRLRTNPKSNVSYIYKNKIDTRSIRKQGLGVADKKHFSRIRTSTVTGVDDEYS